MTCYLSPLGFDLVSSIVNIYYAPSLGRHWGILLCFLSVLLSLVDLAGATFPKLKFSIIIII